MADEEAAGVSFPSNTGQAPLNGIVSGFMAAHALQRQAVLDAAQRAIQAHQMSLEDAQQQTNEDKAEATAKAAADKNQTAQDKLANQASIAKMKWDALAIKDRGQRQQFLLKSGAPVEQIAGIMSELDDHDAAIGASINHGQTQFPLGGVPQSAAPAPDPASAVFPNLPPAPTVGPVAPDPSQPDPTQTPGPSNVVTPGNAGGPPPGGYGVLPGVAAGIDKTRAQANQSDANATRATAQAGYYNSRASTEDALRDLRKGNIQSEIDYRNFRQDWQNRQLQYAQQRDATREAAREAYNRSVDAYHNALINLRSESNAIARQNANTNAQRGAAYVGSVGQRAENDPNVLRTISVLARLKGDAAKKQMGLDSQIQKLKQEQATFNAVMDPNAVVPNQSTNPNGYRQFMLMRQMAPSRLADLNTVITQMEQEHNQMGQELSQYRDMLDMHTKILAPNGSTRRQPAGTTSLPVPQRLPSAPGSLPGFNGPNPTVTFPAGNTRAYDTPRGGGPARPASNRPAARPQPAQRPRAAAPAAPTRTSAPAAPARAAAPHEQQPQASASRVAARSGAQQARTHLVYDPISGQFKQK